MRSSFLLFFPFLLAWTSLGLEKPFSDQDYRHYNWKDFHRLPEAHQVIDLDHPDYDLLNAAVFYTTVRARVQEGLGELDFDPALRNMADFHASAMAQYGFVDHTNPRNPRYATMSQRARQFGARANAENVASTFLHQYQSGTYYLKRETANGLVFLNQRDRVVIPVHTYLSFAQSVVKSWMNSPGHRSNILYPSMDRLGCACAIGADELASGEMPLAYCTQNFGMQ